MRIMVVCGFGLGSSMILKLKIDEALKEQGLRAETFCTDMTTAKGERFDIVITSKDIAVAFKDIPQPVVVVNNFLSKAEVEEKVLPALRSLLENKK
jgi:PTS system ascorbate-specific IIB component